MSRPDLSILYAQHGAQPAPYITGSGQYRCDRCWRWTTPVICLPNMPHGRRTYGQFCQFCLPKVIATLRAK